ncbi:uncharacterized protein J3D65DRAFT_602049 [Phyllosticta citribraziliensis]|uniref:Uncharacterized protein n=1 Tax=Phyllosticta citribraziliensis TaxID=989973 RepID=A0ABR1LZ94_9PEZI
MQSPPLPHVSRSHSWPLSAMERRYNLRPLANRRYRREDSSNHQPPDEPDREKIYAWSSSGSQFSEELVGVGALGRRNAPLADAWNAGYPDSIETRRRFFGLGDNRVALVIGTIAFMVGVLVGSVLMWYHCATTTAANETAAAAAAADSPQQHQPQALLDRLGKDLQMLHWNSLQALGVASPPGAAASDDDVSACLKTIGKSYRYFGGVWHPDQCIYHKAGVLHEWQCNELYKQVTNKGDSAYYSCLGTKRRLEVSSHAMWRRVMEDAAEEE